MPNAQCPNAQCPNAKCLMPTILKRPAHPDHPAELNVFRLKSRYPVQEQRNIKTYGQRVNGLQGTEPLDRERCACPCIRTEVSDHQVLVRIIEIDHPNTT